MVRAASMVCLICVGFAGVTSCESSEAPSVTSMREEAALLRSRLDQCERDKREAREELGDCEHDKATCEDDRDECENKRKRAAPNPNE